MIKIIQTGKIPKEYMKLIDDFIKKIAPYQKVKIENLPEIKLKQDASNMQEKLSMETEKALKRAQGDIYILDADGKIFDTNEFTKMLMDEKNIGKTVTFVVGGSNGFDKGLIENYQTISLSRMTMLHHIAILVLVEAIYRAEKMNTGSAYNK